MTGSASGLPTVTGLLAPLIDVDDRGVYFEDEFTSWRDHIADGAAIAAALRARLDPDKPPHVGVLLQNTPFFSAVLVAAALTGIVPVGLNPVRRGAALARDVSHADCQVVLADSASATGLDVDYIDVIRRSGRRRLPGTGAPPSCRTTPSRAICSCSSIPPAPAANPRR